jgi:hypothetical protein
MAMTVVVDVDVALVRLVENLHRDDCRDEIPAEINALRATAQAALGDDLESWR